MQTNMSWYADLCLHFQRNSPHSSTFALAKRRKWAIPEQINDAYVIDASRGSFVFARQATWRPSRTEVSDDYNKPEKAVRANRISVQCLCLGVRSESSPEGTQRIPQTKRHSTKRKRTKIAACWLTRQSPPPKSPLSTVVWIWEVPLNLWDRVKSTTKEWSWRSKKTTCTRQVTFHKRRQVTIISSYQNIY